MSFAQVRILIVKITGCFLLYCSLKKSCCGEIYGRWETVVVVFVQVFFFFFFFLLFVARKNERGEVRESSVRVPFCCLCRFVFL